MTMTSGKEIGFSIRVCQKVWVHSAPGPEPVKPFCRLFVWSAGDNETAGSGGEPQNLRAARPGD